MYSFAIRRVQCPLVTMLKSSRQSVRTIHAAAPINRKPIFVDTNILIYKGNGSNSQVINKLDTFYNVYYTETVNAEYITNKVVLPNNYKYVLSGLDVIIKNDAYKKFISSHSLSHLTREQKQNFTDDLFIIFEASYLRYNSTKINWDITLDPAAKLLTNNLTLYRTMIANAHVRHDLEKIINAYGFEHLIELIDLNEFLSS